MNKLSLPVLLVLLLVSLLSNSQELKKRTLDSTAILFDSSVYNSTLDHSKKESPYLESNYNSKIKLVDDELEAKKTKEVQKRTFNPPASPPYGPSGPSNMLDIYTLKPSPGDLSGTAPNFSEDLYNGKLNANIPFFEFEYYDYKIPVSINNRYPQVIEDTYGEPTFYVNSIVGGDWTMSLDHYKVSRQVRGIEDEHPTKGYTKPSSYNKITNPQSISNSDVVNGLKGDWDYSPDIFSFSTPTISGSFILGFDDDYEVLTNQKFHLDYEKINNELHSFTVTDNNGIKYLFGGDDSSIEISQSITDHQSFGFYTDGDYNKVTIKYIIEVVNNSIVGVSPFPNNANAFVQNQFPSPYNTPTPNQVLAMAEQQGISAASQFMKNLGTFYDSQAGVNKTYYAITDFTVHNIPPTRLDQETNDPELRRDKVNTAWYLKKITLVNGKKIDFLYQNYTWSAYRTFSSNKIKVDLYTSGSNFVQQINSANGNFSAEVSGIDVYGCFPDQLTFMQFPINETHTQTTHFIKKPFLFRVKDEDGYSKIDLYRDINNPRPYVGNAQLYPNAPSETISTGTSNQGLLSLIRYTRQTGNETTEVQFNNHSLFSFDVYDDGSEGYVPWRDRSYLDEVVINNRKKYRFDYTGSRLKRIHYPTGGIKEFFSTNINSSKNYFNFMWYNYGNSGYLYGLHEAVVDKVITTSEDNTTEDRYVFDEDNTDNNNGVYATAKTYRPDVTTCTSRAGLYATSPIFNSHITKSGTKYLNVEKYTNDELQMVSEYSEVPKTSSNVLLTNETSPNVFIRSPKMARDQKGGFMTKNSLFKTDDDGSSSLVKEVEYNREFEDFSHYPAIYLTNIEAGPYQSIPGAIQRGYAFYTITTEVNLVEEQKIEKEYFNNGSFLTTEQLTNFKRIRIPPIGLNIIKPESTKYFDTEGNYYETKLFSPIEIAGLYSLNTEINIDNNVFSDLLTNNRAPNLETLSFKNGILTNATSTSYKLTPNDPNGESFAVIDKQKMLDIGITNLTENSFSNQAINSNNPQNIIYDPQLEDKIEFDIYDNDGRLLQYHNVEDNTYTSIIWGYKKQRPVAKIVNAQYSEVESFVNDIQNYSDVNGFTSNLLTIFDNLRASLPNAHITSYTYIGGKIGSVTDARGYKTFYEYNDFNELENIKDDEGNIIEQYDYNFKTMSNLTEDFAVSSINWLNPRSYLNVGHNIFCEITPSGGSGDYSYQWTFTRNGIVIASGNDLYSVLDLPDENYTGFIQLEYQVTDNVTNVTLTKSRQFYVNLYPEGAYTISYSNISSPNGVNRTAQVTSPFADTLRFWAFNMSTGGNVTVTIDGNTYTIGDYETRVIEVPVQANETVQCAINGTGNFNYVMLDILDPVYGTVNPVQPKQLHLNNN